MASLICDSSDLSPARSLLQEQSYPESSATHPRAFLSAERRRGSQLVGDALSRVAAPLMTSISRFRRQPHTGSGARKRSADGEQQRVGLDLLEPLRQIPSGAPSRSGPSLSCPSCIGAEGAAEYPTFRLDAVADHAGSAVVTRRRHRVDGALEAVEDPRAPLEPDLHQVAVPIAAVLAPPRGTPFIRACAAPPGLRDLGDRMCQSSCHVFRRSHDRVPPDWVCKRAASRLAEKYQSRRRVGRGSTARAATACRAGDILSVAGWVLLVHHGEARGGPGNESEAREPRWLTTRASRFLVGLEPLAAEACAPRRQGSSQPHPYRLGPRPARAGCTAPSSRREWGATRRRRAPR